MVRIAASLPARAQRVTVFGSTRNSTATSPGVRSSCSTIMASVSAGRSVFLADDDETLPDHHHAPTAIRIEMTHRDQFRDSCTAAPVITLHIPRSTRDTRAGRSAGSPSSASADAEPSSHPRAANPGGAGLVGTEHLLVG